MSDLLEFTLVKKTVTQQRDEIMDSIQESRRLRPGQSVQYTFEEYTRVGVVNAVCERLRWNGTPFSLTPYTQKDSSTLSMSVIVGDDDSQ